VATRIFTLHQNRRFIAFVKSLTSTTSTVVKPPLPQRITPPNIFCSMLVDTSAPRQLLLPLTQDRQPTPTVDKVQKLKTTLRFHRTKHWPRGTIEISQPSFSTKSMHVPPACDACSSHLPIMAILSFRQILKPDIF